MCCTMPESSTPQSSMLVTPSLRPPPTHQLQHWQKRRGLDGGHRHQRHPVLEGDLPWRLKRDAHPSSPTTWAIARHLLPMSSPARLPPHRHSLDAQDCVPSRTRSNSPTTVATMSCYPLTRRIIPSPKLARKRGRIGARARAAKLVRSRLVQRHDGRMGSRPRLVVGLTVARSEADTPAPGGRRTLGRRPTHPRLEDDTPASPRLEARQARA
jgi:hypothetical protein